MDLKESKGLEEEEVLVIVVVFVDGVSILGRSIWDGTALSNFGEIFTFAFFAGGDWGSSFSSYLVRVCLMDGEFFFWTFGKIGSEVEEREEEGWGEGSKKGVFETGFFTGAIFLSDVK